MAYAGKEVRLAVSENLFYDLVDRLGKETDSFITSNDIRELRKDFQQFPFGRYYFEFCQSNGKYLCTLRCKDPDNEQDVQKLQAINDALRDFEFFSRNLGTSAFGPPNPFS